MQDRAGTGDYAGRSRLLQEPGTTHLMLLEFAAAPRIIPVPARSCVSRACVPLLSLSG